MGKPPDSDFTKIPNRIPSVEHRSTLLYTHGVSTGRMDSHRFVDSSSAAAKQFGMFPRKGTLQEAMLMSSFGIRTTEASSLPKVTIMNTDDDGFEGFESTGRPSLVTCRGQVSVRDGEFVGKLGHGKQVPRRRAGV